MTSALTKHIIRKALVRAHTSQLEKKICPPLPPLKSNGGFNVFVFFNIESVMGLGHSLMGYGPVNEPIETFSFYRNSKKVVAPAQIACLHDPTPFSSIVESSGWITHGNNGRFWNEHMTCCLAIECDEKAYKGLVDYANKTKANPGTYHLIKRNCVHIVLQALAAGNMNFDTNTGRDLNPVIPRTVFDDVSDVEGASKFGMWAYWFPVGSPPSNEFPTRPLPVKY